MLLQGRSTSKQNEKTTLRISKCRPEGLYIEAFLLVLIVASLVATALPALKHYNKRSQYREILDISTPVKSTVEKCLGLKRDPKSCDEEKELIAYGGISQHADSASILDSIELELENDQYKLTFTPPESNPVIPFLDESTTLIQRADIIDRNGRPIIEQWNIDPQSGCMLAGLC